MSFLNISNLYQPLKSFYDSDASYSITIKSPQNLESSYSLTLPNIDSGTNQSLITTENGVLSWGEGGIENNTVNTDLTIGKDKDNILTIPSKICIPNGSSYQVLTKQDNGLLDFENYNTIYEYYEIKGKTQNINIQHNNPSISEQTKWLWDKDNSTSIMSSISPLLSWNSDTEFKFNKIGVYKITLKHMVHGISSLQTFNLGSRISDDSGNILLNFSESLRASDQSSYITYNHMEKSSLVEITDTNTVYQWSCSDKSTSFSGIIHKQDETYFTVELMKELESNYTFNSWVLGESSNSTTIQTDDAATNGIADVSAVHNGVSKNIDEVHSIFDGSDALGNVIRNWGNPEPSTPITINITFLEPKQVNHYKVFAYRTSHGASFQWGIKNWNLQGYNTSTNSWDTLDTRTGQSPGGSSYNITSENIISTTQYRWNITEAHNEEGGYGANPGIIYLKLHSGPSP